jgi:hypothetical protein
VLQNCRTNLDPTQTFHISMTEGVRDLVRIAAKLDQRTSSSLSF